MSDGICKHGKRRFYCPACQEKLNRHPIAPLPTWMLVSNANLPGLINIPASPSSPEKEG